MARDGIASTPRRIPEMTGGSRPDADSLRGAPGPRRRRSRIVWGLLLIGAGCASDPSRAEWARYTRGPVRVRAIPHLASSPEPLRREIDAAVAVVANPRPDARARREMDWLVTRGKRAVPALLTALVSLDFRDERDRAALEPLTQTLQRITKASESIAYRYLHYERLDPAIHRCEMIRDAWFRWYDLPEGRDFMVGK